MTNIRPSISVYAELRGLAKTRQITPEVKARLWDTIDAEGFVSHEQLRATFAWLERQPEITFDQWRAVHDPSYATKGAEELRQEFAATHPNFGSENDRDARIAERIQAAASEQTFEQKYADVDICAVVDAERAAKATEPGFYRLADKVYRLKKSQFGRLYAQLVTGKGFSYDGGKGVASQLSAVDLMTPEEVRAHGAATGVCVNCSTVLTDPISIEIGLGTHCGPAILGKEAYKAHRAAAKIIPAVAEALAAIKARKDSESEQLHLV